MAKHSKRSGGEQLAAILAKGRTRNEIVAKLGATPGALSRWLSGGRTPSLEMAVAIERELGIPAEDWLR